MKRGKYRDQIFLGSCPKEEMNICSFKRTGVGTIFKSDNCKDWNKNIHTKFVNTRCKKSFLENGQVLHSNQVSFEQIFFAHVLMQVQTWLKSTLESILLFHVKIFLIRYILLGFIHFFHPWIPINQINCFNVRPNLVSSIAFTLHFM